MRRKPAKFFSMAFEREARSLETPGGLGPAYIALRVDKFVFPCTVMNRATEYVTTIYLLPALFLFMEILVKLVPLEKYQINQTLQLSRDSVM